MSRIGRKAVSIPSGVSVEQAEGRVRVKGPKGTLSAPLPPSVTMEVSEGEVRFARGDDRKPSRAYHGLARAAVANMVRGVTDGFARELQIEGVGYRAEASGRKLTLSVGYSHPVVIDVPEGLSVAVEGTTKIRVTGIDRERVGLFAAELRAVRPPEPYKGKGIRYSGEHVRRKVGKTGATTA
ncbi:MAG TPA: 50S ribosomal protein L6 [Myxococcota bacterium]|nr:50S ribosomal protein L6 [Myxococcota bacterium]